MSLINPFDYTVYPRIQHIQGALRLVRRVSGFAVSCCDVCVTCEAVELLSTYSILPVIFSGVNQGLNPTSAGYFEPGGRHNARRKSDCGNRSTMGRGDGALPDIIAFQQVRDFIKRTFPSNCIA